MPQAVGPQLDSAVIASSVCCPRLRVLEITRSEQVLVPMTRRRVVYGLARDRRRPGIEDVQDPIPKCRESKGDGATASPMRTMRMRPRRPVLKDADIPIVNPLHSGVVQALRQHQ